MQASTASSSATRDSGISLNDVEAPRRSRTKSHATVTPITIANHLPINGHSLSIATRRGSTSTSHDVTDGGPEAASKRVSGGTTTHASTTLTRKSWRKSLDLLGDSVGGDDDDVVTATTGGSGAADDNDSPRTPKYFPRELSLSNRLGGLLVRPTGLPESLVTPLLPPARGGGRVKSGSSSVDNLSTPYSTLSGISNYDYEDDFTSEEEEEDENYSYHHRSRPSSRIPISRSSSLHRRKNLLRNGNTSGVAERPANAAASPLDLTTGGTTVAASEGQLLHRRQSPAAVTPLQQDNSTRWKDTTTATTTVTELDVIFKKSALEGDKAPPSHMSQGAASRQTRTQSVPPGSQARSSQAASGGGGTAGTVVVAKSTSDLPSAAERHQPQHAAGSEPKLAVNGVPQTEPPTRRYNHSISVPGW